jgi:predicted metal-binding protein
VSNRVKQEAQHKLIRLNRLGFLFDTGQANPTTCQVCHVPHAGGQRAVYDAIKANPGEKWYINFSRRRGKTYLLCGLAIEQAMSAPNQQIYYAAATAKAIKKMVRPNFKRILRMFPKDIEVKWKALEGEFEFPNGSVITLAGCDNQNYENLRGTDAHLIIVDEAGFIDELDSVLDDVLMPMTLETNATVIISSTPPKSLDHAACAIAEECLSAGRYFHQTIYDNPRLTHAQVEKFIDKLSRGKSRSNFMKGPTFRREMLAEFVADENDAVVQEWFEHAATSVRSVETPAYCDRYVSMDIGFRDGWGVLFGYWDFQEARLVIEDELLFFAKRTEYVVQECRAKEAELWNTGGIEKTPLPVYRRISDNDLLTIADMASMGYFTSPTAKDDKENQVNRLREWVAAGKIVIRPNCQRLIRQLSNTIWNEQRNDFVRTKEGHGDLLDALIYLCRNVDRQHNPFPNGVAPSTYTHVVTPMYFRNRMSSEAKVLAAMLGRRPGKA